MRGSMERGQYILLSWPAEPFSRAPDGLREQVQVLRVPEHLRRLLGLTIRRGSVHVVHSKRGRPNDDPEER